MEKNKAINLSKQLLDLEFNEFANNPVKYCQSAGWNPGSDSIAKAIEDNNFAPSKDDYNNLALIIESIDSEDALEIIENNTVSDFLVNCVAEHIFQKN